MNNCSGVVNTHLYCLGHEVSSNLSLALEQKRDNKCGGAAGRLC